MCYLNRLTVKPDFSPAMFFPRARYGVLYLPVWELVVKCRFVRQQKRCIDVQSCMSFHIAPRGFVQTGTPKAGGILIVGVKTVCYPSLSDARELRGRSQKRACPESWVGVGRQAREGSGIGTLLASQEAPLFTPTEHAMSVAFGRLLNSTGNTGSFIH